MRKLNFKKYLLLFLFICLCFIITDKLVKADTITNYSTRYYWCTVLGDTVQNCQYTTFRSGSDNKLTAYGLEEDSPRYSQYETFNGMNNLINVSLTSGSTYTFKIDLIYSNVGPNEWGPNNLSRFVTYKYFNAGIISNVTTSYNKSSNCISYGGATYCDYNVSVVYTIIPDSNVSSFYLGSYTTDDKTFGLDSHYLTSIIRVNSISYSVNNDSTIVNQNQTIIDQNQQIINGQQDIIDSQNENTEKEIESQKVCKTIDKNSIIVDGFLNSSGNVGSSNSYGVTDYLKINSSKIKVLNSYSAYYFCFYDVNKNKLSCSPSDSVSDNSLIDIPTNAEYVRFTINKSVNKPQYQICTNGNQALNDSINDLNDNMNNDDVTGATDEASDFFSSFSTDTFGLTSIITAPLNLIQSLTSSTCTQLHLPLPYLDNKYIDLPCMTTIYQTHFGTFFTMYQTITYGIIAYWVIVRIFNQVKDFKNPEHDEIEVVDL